MSERRQLILDTVSDLVGKFLYYDRKDDEELSVEDIEEALAAGEITTADIVKHFEAELVKVRSLNNGR